MSTVPAVGELPALHTQQRVGELGMLHGVALEQVHPLVAQRTAALAELGGEVLVHLLGDAELRVLGPAVEALRGPYLVLAERFTVGLRSVLLGRRPVGDRTVDDDQCRSMLLVAECRVGAGQHREVVGISHSGDVPPESDESSGDVLAKGQRRSPLDRDAVVVVDPAQVREAQDGRPATPPRRRPPPSCRRHRTGRRHRSRTSRSRGG